MSHFPLHQCYSLAESFLLLPVNQTDLKPRANNLWRTCLHKRPHYTSNASSTAVQRPQKKKKTSVIRQRETYGWDDCHVILKFKTTELRHYTTCGSLFGHSGSGCWVGFAVTLWVMATLSMFSMLLNVCRIQKERHVESLTAETEA